PKDHDGDFAALVVDWRRRAAEAGFDPDRIPALVGQATPKPLVVDSDELAQALTIESSTFDRTDALRAVAERAATGASVEDVEAVADAFLAGDPVAWLADDIYTTPEMLRLETAIMTNAQTRLGAGMGIAPSAAIEAELGSRRWLSNEQADMIRHLAGSGNGVDVVLGVAGAGKTHALECARAAWEAGGHETLGVALAALAATELEQRSGIPSRTVDRLLMELDRGGTSLGPRTVFVVDEAGMVDTRRLARLLAHADAAQAKVVLVGDDQQLPEIEAGGAFAGLLRRLPAVVLAENRRQTDPVDRQALAELRTGDAEAAVRRLVDNGRLTLVDSTDVARCQMVSDWLAARRNAEDAVMLAVRRADVHELNRLARAELVAAGAVRQDGITANGSTFGVGDRVMALANRRRLDVVNGARGTVTAAGEAGVAVRLDGGATVTLPADYLHAGNLTHAYATTIHKAQGMTCDRSLVLAGDALFREAGYTALSRGRAENRLYLVAPEPPDVDVGYGIRGDRAGAIDELVSALEHSRRKHPAIERLTRLAPPAPSPAPGLGIDL
ncbi:MAG: AAA family ATPase, partial [Acidimicrobiia bacterium]